MEKKCPFCDSKLLLRFDINVKPMPSHIFYCDNVNHEIVSFTAEEVYRNHELYNFVNTNGKGFAYYIHRRSKELNDNEKMELDNVIKLKMYEILKHYVECRVGGCYSAIFKYLLIQYLDDVNVLSAFLKSKYIKEFGRQPIVKSINGEKIYYNLFYDFMLINSKLIKDFLAKLFPSYYKDFLENILPSEKYSFINYNNKEIIYNDAE